MSPLAGKHTYVRLAIIIFCQIRALFLIISNHENKWNRTNPRYPMVSNALESRENH